MKNVRDLEINDLKKLLEEMGEKPFRVGECVEGSGKVVYSDER